MAATPTEPAQNAVRVLVADGDGEAATTLGEQLTLCGYGVAGVFSRGEDIISRVWSEPPHVLITGLRLAGDVSGPAVAAHMGAPYDVAVIYLADAEDEIVFPHVLPAAPAAWLVRPVSFHVLNRSLQLAVAAQAAYREVLRSEKQCRGIVEHLSEGVVILDDAMRVSFANPSFARMAGKEPAALTGALAECFLCDSGLDALRARSEHLCVGEKATFSAKLQCEAGRSTPVSVLVSAKTSLGQKSLTCIVTDTSEQLASAAALRRAEGKYRALFENALDGLFQSTPDGQLLEVNSAMAALFDYSSPEVMRSAVRNAVQLYVLPEDRKLLLGVLEKEGRISRFQARFTRRNGTTFWGEISARCARNADGTMQYFEGVVADISDRKLAERELLRRASRDDLTGLHNRVYFREWLAKRLKSAARHRNQLGVLYVDLNEFKQINDTWGHLVGDRVLREMALRIQAQVRETDMVARIGGDEFCVVLEGVHSIEDMRRVAGAISRELTTPVIGGDGEFCLGGSIGIAVFPEDGVDVDTLLQKADKAMYAAKCAEQCAFAFWGEGDMTRNAG